MSEDRRRAIARLIDAFGTTDARRIAAVMNPAALRLVDRVIAERTAVRLLSAGEPRPVILDRLESGHVGSRRSAQRLLAQVVAPRQNEALFGAPGADHRASPPGNSSS